MDNEDMAGGCIDKSVFVTIERRRRNGVDPTMVKHARSTITRVIDLAGLAPISA